MQLDQELQNVSSVAIAGHIRPDGDCVGSCLATYNYITTYYPQVKVCVFLEPIPRIFQFLQGADKILEAKDSEESFDLCIVLDCGDATRLGDAVKFFETAKRTICIDHHVSNQAFADKNKIVADASSASELVYDSMDPAKITKEIAECIYTGMIHDTGVFQYSCTSSHTMEVAGCLMDLGIDYPTIVDKTFYEKTFAQNKILGQALLKSRLYEDAECIASVITQEEMAEFSVLPKHLDGIVSQLRMTKEAEVAIFLYGLEPGAYKVSTRCKGDRVDLSQIAMKYHGGGHKKAAGFTVEGDDPWALIDGIVTDVREQLAQ